MSYAIIQLAGKQFKVSVGDELIVDRQSDFSDRVRRVSEILLLVDERGVQVGTPFVDKAYVELTKISDLQGPKLRIGKFKAKSRYRRVIGFRQKQSKLKVTALGAGKDSERLPAAEKKSDLPARRAVRSAKK